MDPSSTNQMTSALVTQYGLAGFVVFSSLGALIYVVKDLLAKADKKDEQIMKMSTDFSVALKNNTDAIQSIKESEIKLASATDHFQKWLSDSVRQNEKDHSQILDFMKATARR